jgi:hypothetical protein
MSIEALWAVKFTGVQGVRLAKSGGIIVIESNRIFGGDTWQWYTGTYDRDTKTGRLTCRIKTGVHFTDGGQSIFGGPLQAQILVGEIQVSDDLRTMTANLTVEGSPQMKLSATLTRVAELP